MSTLCMHILDKKTLNYLSIGPIQKIKMGVMGLFEMVSVLDLDLYQKRKSKTIRN